MAHEITVFIPDKVWRQKEFYDKLPAYGVKYYIDGENIEGKKLLDKMYIMPDDEKLEYFKLIIFDSPSFRHMGINTRHLTMSDIKLALGL